MSDETLTNNRTFGPKFAEAMAKAQAEMGAASKDKTNPHYNKSYADFESVRQACIGPLTKHGLSIVQPTAYEGNTVYVTTMILHQSGEYLESTLAVPVSKADAQGIGSAMTYGRRYGLMAMTGIAPADDDGNAAVGGEAPARTAKPPAKPKAPAVPLADDEDIDEILNLAERRMSAATFDGYVAPDDPREHARKAIGVFLGQNKLPGGIGKLPKSWVERLTKKLTEGGLDAVLGLPQHEQEKDAA